MTVEQFRKFQSARPFQPFTIRMADGKSYDISHPELIASSPTGRTVLIAYADDNIVILDLVLVTAIQTKPSAPASA